MTEAATAFWTPFQLSDRRLGAPIPGERSRKFESVENAVAFVQGLPRPDRQTAFIQTDSQPLFIADIEAIHAGMKMRPR
jgi:hypothetical protein